jgi:hypothetical protein
VNRVGPGGMLTPVVGSGQPCSGGPFGTEFAFDGKPALQAQLCEVPSMMVDRNGIIYLAYGGQILRVTTDGIIHTVAGNALGTASGDGGPALQAGMEPGTPTFDSAGDMFFPDNVQSLIREVTTTPYALKLSPDHIGWVGPQGQTWSIATTANFAEPFPYSVRVNTNDGGSWLGANRVTGLIGEPITVTINPAGLASGFYQGTVSVVLPIGAQLDVPVSLLVQQ